MRQFCLLSLLPVRGAIEFHLEDCKTTRRYVMSQCTGYEQSLRTFVYENGSRCKNVEPGDRDPLVDVETFEQEGGNVIVGTPGRISDVMQRSALLDTRQLEVPGFSFASNRPLVMICPCVPEQLRSCSPLLMILLSPSCKLFQAT